MEEVISVSKASEKEIKQMIEVLDNYRQNFKQGKEQYEIDELKRYLLMTLSHWKRNASVVAELNTEFKLTKNIDGNTIQMQESVILDQRRILDELNKSN